MMPGVMGFAGSRWHDPETSWQVKLARAGEHLAALRAEVDVYLATEPFSVTPESTDVPDQLAYRLRLAGPVPVRIAATVGDILSNLRAALECLAFAMAEHFQGGQLTSEQERASAFPIKASPEEFDAFFNARRLALYGPEIRNVFRSLQPFYYDEMATSGGANLDGSYQDRARWHPLYRLERLWNIDKHRRLAVALWWPDLVYWGSDGPSERSMLPGDGTAADDSVLFYMQGHDVGTEDRVYHEFQLALRDDPGFSPANGVVAGVVDLMDTFVRNVQYKVFPQLFAAMR